MEELLKSVEYQEGFFASREFWESHQHYHPQSLQLCGRFLILKGKGMLQFNACGLVVLCPDRFFSLCGGGEKKKGLVS